MTTAVELARSAIQSSAASKPDPTTIRVTSGWTGTRIIILLTMETRTSWRKATLYTSSFTGHASASTNMWRVSIISGFHLGGRRAYLVAYWPVSALKCSRAKALAAVARSEEHTSEHQ